MDGGLGETMGLFDSGAPQTLQDVLSRQADTATMGIDQNYANKRRKLISSQAAGGRLGSGVANYSLTGLDTQQLGDIAGVDQSLSEALGGVPAEDFGSSQDYQRQVDLAKLIGAKNKPSKLSGVLGGAGSLGGAGAAFGPWGAGIGAVGGGLLGGLS
jgi:hypothetical protein